MTTSHRHDPDPHEAGQPPAGPDDRPPHDPLLDDDEPPADAEPPADVDAASRDAEDEVRFYPEPPVDAEDQAAGRDGEPRAERDLGGDAPAGRSGPAAEEVPAAEEAPAPPPDPQQTAGEGPARGLLGAGPFTRAELRAARPRVVLHFHLAEATVRDGGIGLVRPEHGDPITLTQLLGWLAETGCVVQVRPVQIPAEVEPVDGYEIPARVREATRFREIADISPWGSCTSPGMDLDHTRPYRAPARGGPAGQTGPGTLGPLARGNHLTATFGGWGRRQPAPGVYVWRSPQARVFLVTNHGTIPLGSTGYAHTVWAAARPEPDP